jgi:hypothetical protein
MKTVGIIGGIGPESTVEYYQYIIASYRERRTMVFWWKPEPDSNGHTQSTRGYVCNR